MQDRRAVRPSGEPRREALHAACRAIVRRVETLGPAPGALLFVGYILVVAAVSWFRPAANWDMIAYAAAAIEHRSDGLDAATLHARAFEAVRAAVSPDEFTVLTADRDYRVRQYADPAAFRSVLGFYRVKTLYVGAAAWLSRWMSPVEALRLISTLSALLVGAIGLVWCARRGFLRRAPLVAGLLALAGLGIDARQITPDLAAAAFTLGGALLFLERRMAAAAAMLFVACLVRPDQLAFLACLWLLVAPAGRRHAPLLVAAGAALAAALAVSAANGHPGWWVQMWVMAIEPVPDIAGFDPPFSPAIYAGMLARVLVKAAVQETWPFLLLGGTAFLGVFLARGHSLAPGLAPLVGAAILSEPAKFLVAPLDEGRFHFASVVILGMVCIEAARFARPALACAARPAA